MLQKIKRVLPDLTVALFALIMFLVHSYIEIPAPLQLVILKMMLVSFGILHAHITRKVLLPTVTVNWNDVVMTNGVKMVIAMYIVIPVLYAFGG